MRSLSDVLCATGAAIDGDRACRRDFERALREIRPDTRATSGVDEDGEDSELPVVECLHRGRRTSLFPYQLDIVDQIRELVTSTDHRTGLVSLPTGAGKTRVACAACMEMLRDGTIRHVLWAAPSIELVTQAADALRRFSAEGEGPPTMDLVRGIGSSLGAGRPTVNLCTAQFLASRTAKGCSALETVDLIVFDEAHFGLAPTYRRVLEQMKKRKCAIVGLTATPGRRTEHGCEELADLFDNRWLIASGLSPRPIDALRSLGVLSSIAFRMVDFEGAGRGTRLSRRFRKTLPLKALVCHPGRFRATIEAIAEVPGPERVIVFAGGLSHAAALAVALRNRGKAVGLVSSYQDPKERRSVLESFSAGRVSVVINKSVLIAGYDCPATKHVVITVPVSSAITFEQMVGRASRGPSVGGNSDSFVWMLDDLTALHGLPSSYGRFNKHSWFRDCD